jgi:hypothetical protein
VQSGGAESVCMLCSFPAFSLCGLLSLSRLIHTQGKFTGGILFDWEKDKDIIEGVCTTEQERPLEFRVVTEPRNAHIQLLPWTPVLKAAEAILSSSPPSQDEKCIVS